MSTRLPGMGVLIRRLAVRVRNVSASGCLLETADQLPEGAVGLLELVIDGERHVEALRVNRSTRIAGSAWPWRTAAQFLALSAPLPTSVRNVVARFEIMEELDSWRPRESFPGIRRL